MPKLTFDEALDDLQEGRGLCRNNVRADALRRKVWVASNGLPGCLNDSMSVLVRKQDAIDHCLHTADNGEGPPRGMKSYLSLSGDRTWSEDGYLYRVERMTLDDLF